MVGRKASMSGHERQDGVDPIKLGRRTMDPLHGLTPWQAMVVPRLRESRVDPKTWGRNSDPLPLALARLGRDSSIRRRHVDGDGHGEINRYIRQHDGKRPHKTAAWENMTHNGQVEETRKFLDGTPSACRLNMASCFLRCRRGPRALKATAPFGLCFRDRFRLRLTTNGAGHCPPKGRQWLVPAIQTPEGWTNGRRGF